MKKNKGIFVKVDAVFLAHINRYFAENKEEMGLSAYVRKSLARKTKYQKEAVSDVYPH